MKKILLSIIPIVVFIALAYGGYTYKQYSSFYNNLRPLANTSIKATISIDEVATHTSTTSCYTIINRNVYDLTTWIDKHPGGPQRILSLCGKDGTNKFQAQHGNDNKPQSILLGFQIGVLAK